MTGRPHISASVRRLLVAFFLFGAAPATASLAPNELAAIGVDPAPGATFPLDQPLIGLEGRQMTLGAAIDGKPSAVVFVDYTCKTLCSPVLAIVSSALARSGLTPGTDFRLITIGLNPKNSAEDARRMVEAEIGLTTPLGRAVAALRADAAAAQRLTAAVGYRYAYDAERDQYAHPAAVLVAGADGRVSRVLSGLALSPNDAKLALIEAGRGAIGGIGDQILLHCYGFDPTVGFYTDRISLILVASCCLTVILIVVGLASLSGKLHVARRPS
jgi:protein SCO1/2